MDDTLSVGDTSVYRLCCGYVDHSTDFYCRYRPDLSVESPIKISVHNEVAVGSRQDRKMPSVQDQHEGHSFWDERMVVICVFGDVNWGGLEKVISFKIEVANRYKLNKSLKKLATKLAEEPGNIPLRNQVSKAKLAAVAENEDNVLEQKRQQGKKVLYGQVIQLRHLFTNKYIHVSTTKTSNTETNNMAVELLAENAKHAQFRIMPRYKVKAEGDVVQVDDQVVLESVKSSGSYLHVSKSVLGQVSVYRRSHELNLSVQQSGFTIYRKYKPAPEDMDRVKVGDIIRFYHKEMEAYLVAEGLFDDELLEDVHLRMRPMDPANPKTLFPSTSAVTYWQIELQEGPVQGGVLKWEQQCKIIHMCTRKYLTVKDGHVTLTGDHRDPTTVFRLHPVIRENDDIPLDSYCRIEHVVSGSWLHACPEEYVRKQTMKSEDNKAMASLKWSTAELKQIGIIEEKQYDDAFTIQGVEEEHVEIFHHMAGMVPFIQKLVSDKKSGLTLNAKMAHDTVVALGELSRYMIVDGQPEKNRQKLMRNLRIVELLIYLLQIPFRGSDDQFHLTKIFVEAYNVLYTYLMGDSRKNELYIAKYIDFFLSQFELKEGQIGLNAAHMVMELIKDNRKIVDRISHDHINKFVELLQRDKNHRYLDLLAVLCVCDGVSIPDNQIYITQVWLMKGNRQNCVHYTDLGQKIGKEPGVVYVSTTQGRKWMELAEFAQNRDGEDYLFLEHQLELFGDLCHGQNDFSIKVITQELNYLTWEEAFTCLSDERLPDKLRSQYCDLIITMFVDIGANHSIIDRVKLSYIYDEIDSYENSDSDSVIDYVERSVSAVSYSTPSIRPISRKSTHPDITLKLPKILESRGREVEEGGSKLQYLDHYYHLISHRSKSSLSKTAKLTWKDTDSDTLSTGLPSWDEIDHSHSMTYQVFPTLSDWISTFLKYNGDMTASNIGNNMLVEQVLRLVEYLVSFGFYYKPEDIKKLMEPLMSLIDGRNDKPYPNVTGKDADDILRVFRTKERFERSTETTAVVGAKCQALEVLNLFFNYIFNLRLEKFMNMFKVTHTHANTPQMPPPELGPLLYEAFDLSVHQGVSKTALRKLKEIFDHTNYLKTYDLVDVLKDLSSYHYDNMIRMSMHLLNRYYSAHNELFGNAVQAQVLITDKSVEAFNNLEKILPHLRRLASSKLSNQQGEELVSLLDQLILMCHLDGEPEEEHGMNQSILYNHGVIEDMFTILQQEIDIKLLDQYTGLKKVFQRTFTLLKLMARNNKLVQGRLFDRLDLLLSTEGAGEELAECITEVFTGNSNTCMKISGNQVQRIMTLVAKNKEKVPQFLDLLNAVVKVEELDLPLKRNQSFVMQYFMQFRSDIANVIDQDEAAREKILTESGNKQLHYLIGMVDMLATCAEGENRHIESICQTIFRIPELLRLLTNPQISNNFKQPILRFFLWVYLNTAGGMIESGAGDMPHDKSMWQYLAEITKTLTEVAEYGRSDPVSTKLLLKRPPGKSDRGESKQESIRGTLHYLFEGVMPFLQIFCRSFYQPDSSMFPEEPEQMDKLATSFKDFMEVIAPLISIERQMKNLVSCMTSLLSASTLPVRLKAIEDVQNALNHYNVVTSTLDHLNSTQDSVVRETLGFLASLLFNGNEDVQNSLIAYFTGTREETFFFAIKSRIHMSALATREKRLLHAMHQAKVEEAVQQAKALRKAMETGKLAQTEIMKANQLGSMLSMAKKRSMANLKVGSNAGSRMGSRSRLGSQLGSQSKLSQGKSNLGSNMLLPGVMMNGGNKSSLQLNGLAGSKSKVAPMENPEVIIGNVEEEELQELMEAAMSMSGDLEFRDDGYIELVLRILGLMCDNQHHDIQNYLREQPDNIKSVNLVGETTKFLNILYSNISDKSMPLVVQLFDTLVEFTSGNQKNQAMVFDNKVCDYINHILRVGHFHNCGIKEEYVLKKSIATLIRSLTEENPPVEDEDTLLAKPEKKEDRTVTVEVMEYLDADLCVITMTEAFNQLQKRDPDFDELYNLIQDTGYAYYHILYLVKNPNQNMAWDFFAMSTMSIEVIKDDVLQKIYYRVKDRNVLREEIKEKFKYDVDRTTPSNKIRDFMDWASDIIQDIKYQRKVHANPVGQMLVKLWIPINYIVVFLSFVISIIIMITWRDPKLADGTSDTNSAKPEYTMSNYEPFLYVWGGVHNLLSLCILITFLISNNPTFPPYTWIKKKLSSNDDENDFRSWHEKKTGRSHLEIEIYNFKTIYYFVFFACSVLGTVFYGYFFAFHLLHISELNQLLKRVIAAVTTNGKSLLMVALLGLAVFFCYSLISFAFFRETFLKEDDGRHCRTVYHCFITMIHHGFVDSPYTTFEALMDNDFDKAIYVTIFDVTFFILVTTVGLNIIFGIIVDTFSQLRDAKWEIDKDMMNNCFICSRESYDFERHGGGFEKHVRTEHYQWAYLFFFLHLDETRPNDYSALELHVFNQLQHNVYDFFPLNRALSLINEENTKERKLESLRVNIEYMVNKMKEEEAAREREKERQKQIAWEAQHKSTKASGQKE
uniref:Inositol 1,4,5-trisphosphate receptor n=1 Tax=Magallana gigas TaxID=29159 RepID=K1QLV5_MAGGI